MLLRVHKCLFASNVSLYNMLYRYIVQVLAVSFSVFFFFFSISVYHSLTIKHTANHPVTLVEPSEIMVGCHFGLIEECAEISR